MKKLGDNDDDISKRSHVLDKSSIVKRKEQSKNNILEIMRNDFRSCFKNPIVILVLLAIIILPSLYGLVNIYACWDPYENTGHIQFAIANDDKGATYQNYTINAGNDLVDSLKTDTSFDWVFVSSDELRTGVHNGKYYAGIVIPNNFSQSVVSITSDNPHSAQLEYIVNDKTNPVACKLTDSAARAIYNKLNAEIVSFINVVAYNKLEELETGLSSGASEMEGGADKLSAGADKLSSGANQVVGGANQLSGGANSLSNGAYELSNGANQLSTGSNKLVTGAEAISAGATSLSIESNKLSAGADQVSSGASQVADGTKQMANKTRDMYITYLKIKQLLDNGGDTDKLIKDVDKLDSDTSKLAKQMNELDNQTQEVSNDALNLYSKSDNLNDEAITIVTQTNDVANKTHEISNQMNNISAHISQLKYAMDSGNQKEIQELLKQIESEMNGSDQKLNELTTGAYIVANGSSQVAGGASQLSGGALQLANGSQELAVGASQLANGSSQVAGGASQLANGSSELADGATQLSNGVVVLANGTMELADGAKVLGYSSSSALKNASDSIGSAADQLATVTGLTDDQVENYFYSPVELKRNDEFSTNNYGSQVAPFYIVLSMWVGALITCVMLKVGSSVGTKYKPHEMYLGKLLLFNIMAILQTTVTLIGLHILGIDILNEGLFIFSCYFVAIIFMAITYSLISLFGAVGEGISILLLVFQISGSGGIYPIEIMSKIFGIIYPYLPMTHGITLVRESQLGLIGSNYLPSFLFLWVVGIIVIIGSVILKQRWDKRTKFFEEKLEESNLFN